MIAMPDEFHPFQMQIIALAGELAEMFAFNRSVGQIFGFLYTAPRPVSLKDIAGACQMSKGNASIQLRALENWGAVHRSAKLGSREDYYSANVDLRALAARRFHEGLRRRLSAARHAIGRLKEDSRYQDLLRHEMGKNMAGRVEQIAELINEAESALALIPKIAKLKNLLS